jgi:hypothetical protein
MGQGIDDVEITTQQMETEIPVIIVTQAHPFPDYRLIAIPAIR